MLLGPSLRIVYPLTMLTLCRRAEYRGAVTVDLQLPVVKVTDYLSMSAT